MVFYVVVLIAAVVSVDLLFFTNRVYFVRLGIGGRSTMRSA